MMNKNIVLFGFMGCGKSTVGTELARKTGRKLVDTDALIEKREGMSVSEIFSKHGEEYFRNREHEICVELAGKERLIISAGGEGCKLVLLDVPPEVIYERLKYDTTRPLLQCDDKLGAIRELYARREAIYREAADYVVNGDRPRGFVALDVMKAVGIL